MHAYKHTYICTHVYVHIHIPMASVMNDRNMDILGVQDIP